MTTIGNKIAFYRKAKQMTQEELADRLDVSAQAVSKWENNLTCPDIQLLIPLATIFETTTDELLSKEDIKRVKVDFQHDLHNRILKVSVDSKEGDKIRIQLPMEVVKVALQIGSGIPQLTTNAYVQNIDFHQIMIMVEHGVIGNLVEIESADGDVIHVVVE